MGFFNSKQKKLARKCSTQDLMQGYKASESALRMASYSGNTKELKKAMKLHGYYEYAILYKNTPEFYRKKK